MFFVPCCSAGKMQLNIMLLFFVCASLQASFYMHRHCALQSNARMSKPSEHLQGGTLLVFPPLGTPGDESALVMEIH